MSRRHRRPQSLAFAGVRFYALKAGIATALASAIAITPATARLMGDSGDWVVITVTVVCSMGPTLGGVVSRGVNRGVGTLVAVLLAVPINALAELGGALVSQVLIPPVILLVTCASYYLINRARSAASDWEYALVLFNLSFCMLLHVNYRLGLESSLYRIGTILLGALLALLAAGAWPDLASDRLDLEAAAALQEAGKLVSLSAAKFTRADSGDDGSEARASGKGAPADAPLETAAAEGASAAVASSRLLLTSLRANVHKHLGFAKWEPRRGAGRGAQERGSKRGDSHAETAATAERKGALAAAPAAVDGAARAGRRDPCCSAGALRGAAAAVSSWLAGGTSDPLLRSYARFEQALADFASAAASLDALGVSAAQEPPLSPLASPASSPRRGQVQSSSMQGAQPGEARELPPAPERAASRARRPVVVPLSAPIRELAAALEGALVDAGAAVGTVPQLIWLQPARLLGAQAPRVCEGEAHARVARACAELRVQLERFAARLRGGTAQEVLDRARALAFAQELASLATVQYARLAAAADEVVDLSMGDPQWREHSQPAPRAASPARLRAVEVQSQHQ